MFLCLRSYFAIESPVSDLSEEFNIAKLGSIRNLNRIIYIANDNSKKAKEDFCEKIYKIVFINIRFMREKTTTIAHDLIGRQ